MSKAIFVIDMPENCNECPLEIDVDHVLGANICRGCEKYSYNSNSNIKPDFCPLKPLPEKMEVCGTYGKGHIPASYKIGWNACIEEMLKERIKALILPTKEKWFRMIAAGEKWDEYREIKPYYTSRLKKYAYVPQCPMRHSLKN